MRKSNPKNYGRYRIRDDFDRRNQQNATLLIANKILIVDDEIEVRNWLAELLVGRSYHITVAEGVQDGLHQTNIVKPDLILLAWQMQNHDGLEMLFHLRQNPLPEDAMYHCGPFGQQVPVLLMGRKNAWYFTEAFVKELPWKVDGYLTKPFRIEQLFAEVAKLLPTEQLQRETF